MEIRVLKIIIDTIVKDRYHFLAPPEVYLADKHNPKVLQLYRLIKDGRIKNDDEAMAILYPVLPMPKEYKIVKDELVEKIEILLLGINPDKAINTVYTKAIFYSFRSLFASYILKLIEKVQHQAEYWNEKTYSTAKPYDINSATLLASYSLTEHAAYKNKPEDWIKYKAQFENELDHFITEKKLNLMDQELVLIMLSSESANYKFVGRMKKYYSKSLKLAAKYPSYSILLSSLNIGFRYAQAARNPMLVIKLANEHDQLLNRFPEHKNSRTLIKSAIYRMESYMLLRDYDKGKNEVKQSLRYFAPGTFNWLAFLEYYFLMCMHSKNYEQALNIYYQVFKSEYFPLLNPEIQERWKYFEPFLNYILPEQFPKESFNLLGFLDEISYYTNHKSDNNITIMIGQIIVMLEMQEFEKLSERTNYLKDYIAKYIDKKIYPRSYIFLKMLLKLFESNFNVFKVNAKTRKFYNMLEPFEGNKLFSPEGIEVIPYDTLWPMIIGKLKK